MIPSSLARALPRTLIAGLALVLAACGQPSGRPKPPDSLTIAAEIDYRPESLAALSDNRLFLTLRNAGAGPRGVVELAADGNLQPYPDEVWNAPSPGEDAIDNTLISVTALTLDRNGVLWMLDNGTANGRSRKVVSWNTVTDEPEGVYLLEGLTTPYSFLHDLAVDPERRAIFISDSGQLGVAESSPAIIVVNLESGRGRRVLSEDQRLRAEDVDIAINGQVMGVTRQGGFSPARIGIGPIAIDPSGYWLYFGAVNSESLYRIRASDLLDNLLTEAQLSARIEFFGDKPVSERIAVDHRGSVFVTDLNSNTVGVVREDGAYYPLVTHSKIAWPKGLSIAPDGSVFVAAARLHESSLFEPNAGPARAPFHILKIRSIASVALD